MEDAEEEFPAEGEFEVDGGVLSEVGEELASVVGEDCDAVVDDAAGAVVEEAKEGADGSDAVVDGDAEGSVGFPVEIDV